MEDALGLLNFIPTNDVQNWGERLADVEAADLAGLLNAVYAQGESEGQERLVQLMQGGDGATEPPEG
jgi:hypothetical protein